MRSVLLAPFLALLSLVATACGDGGDVPSSPTPAATQMVEATGVPATATAARQTGMQVYKVPPGSAPHDVAPAADGGIWYTAQGAGKLGWLDPATGNVTEIPLGSGSAPHGVIVGPDGAAWVTDGGLNAIVRVDGVSREVRRFTLTSNRANANLNTATFDSLGRLWFTGQNGVYGRLDPATGDMQVWDAPSGRGPYGITTTPDGDVYYASLAGSYVGKVDPETGEATVLRPPTSGQGARRIWSDSAGRVWVSEWNAGRVAVYEPSKDEWREWKLPGASPQAYAVYADDQGSVWLSDFGGNAIHRFDPEVERFETLELPDRPGNVRQLHGRAGEVWGAESAADAIIVIRF